MESTYLTCRTNVLHCLKKHPSRSRASVFMMVHLAEADDTFDEVPIIVDPGSNGASKHEHHARQGPGVGCVGNFQLNGLYRISLITCQREREGCTCISRTIVPQRSVKTCTRVLHTVESKGRENRHQMYCT